MIVVTVSGTRICVGHAQSRTEGRIVIHCLRETLSPPPSGKATLLVYAVGAPACVAEQLRSRPRSPSSARCAGSEPRLSCGKHGLGIQVQRGNADAAETTIGPIAPGARSLLARPPKKLAVVPVEEGSMPHEQSARSVASAASAFPFEPWMGDRFPGACFHQFRRGSLYRGKSRQVFGWRLRGRP